ncbi:MAG: hypothetical protein Q6J68_00840 [Thermostichales cyanobacterium SZTDM-1c_bins_54]
MLIIKAQELTAAKPENGTPLAQFRGKTYALAGTYRTMQDAIVSCRHDLDSGKFSLVVQEASQFSVWRALGVPAATSS